MLGASPLTTVQLNKLFGILLLGKVVDSPQLTYLLNHLHGLMSTPRYLFYTLSYNAILLCFVAQIIPALLLRVSLKPLAFGSWILLHTSIFFFKVPPHFLIL